MTTADPRRRPRHVRPAPDALDQLLAQANLTPEEKAAIQRHADRLLAAEERRTH